MKAALLAGGIVAISVTVTFCRSESPLVLRFDPRDPPGITYPTLASSVPYHCAQEDAPKVRVLFTVSIDSQGVVSNVKVRGLVEEDKGKKFVCEKEAIAAIDQWRMTPALKDGKPIPVVGMVGLVMPIDDSK